MKCGGTIDAGGAAERFGVKPDLSTWAKSIGGGAAIGAFGGRADIMDEINQGAAHQGTFNGNPLSVAAALATFTKVLTAGRLRPLRSHRCPARRAASIR